MLFLVTSLAASVPARAGTIGITYSFSGVGTVTGLSGGFLDLSGAATGSVDQWNPAVNAVWDPVTYDDIGQLNLSTGLFNGVFTITFATGDTLSGTVFEDQTMVNTTTTTGPFTQTLTFTAGTGEFAGVSGTGSGGGFVTPTGYTDSGSGTLTAPGLVAPEPGSSALVFGGLVLIALGYRPQPANRMENNHRL